MLPIVSKTRAPADALGNPERFVPMPANRTDIAGEGTGARQNTFSVATPSKTFLKPP